MSDDVDKQNEAPAEEAQGPVGGERLAEARREQQISVLEIAKELHIDEFKVRALERNEFDVLGAPVFAKGHLKKYAQLVGASEEDVLADYYKLNRSEGIPPVVSSRPRPRQELTPGPWIAVIVVIIITVTAYWWFTRPSEPQPEPEAAGLQDEAVPAPVGTDEGDTGEPAAAEIPDEAEPDVQAKPEQQVEPDVQAEPEPEAATPTIDETTSPEIIPGQMRLLLTYTGDCWTEVSDANGRRLFFDLGKDGRSVELSGAEPFNVLFGNPGNVSVLVNGDDYVLPADAQPDRPLRLTISGY